METGSKSSFFVFLKGLKEEFFEITWPTKIHLVRSVFIACILVSFSIFFVIFVDFLIIKIFLFCKKLI